MRSIEISGKTIRDSAYFIAEIAGNFKDVDEAKKLIDGAVYAGADAVKLQTYRAETLASTIAEYDMENTGKVNQFELFKEGELSEQDHETIFAYARDSGIDIFSTPSHRSDVALLQKLGATVFKIGSDDSNNLPFIQEVAEIADCLMIATGMRTIEEVDEIIGTLHNAGNENFVLFHAVTSYPTPYELANLAVVKTFLDRYPDVLISYSDHTIGWQCAYAARVMGALVIERHFTLDRNAEGPDHILSSTPEEMKILIDAVRIYEEAIGDGVKQPVGQELINRRNNGKSLVLERDVNKDHALTEQDVAIKRPGFGIEPKKFQKVIGKRTLRNLKKDEVLTWADLGESE